MANHHISSRRCYYPQSEAVIFHGGHDSGSRQFRHEATVIWRIRSRVPIAPTPRLTSRRFTQDAKLFDGYNKRGGCV